MSICSIVRVMADRCQWQWVRNFFGSLEKISNPNVVLPFSSPPTVSKPRIIILGTGWASMHFFKYLCLSQYEVLVVSPRNYFTFTPLLPSVCSGTLSPLACIEPVRRFTRRWGRIVAGFLECLCTDVDFDNNKIICRGEAESYVELYYDYLILGIGAQPSSLDIPGVLRYACFLKEVEHAIQIRKKIMNNFEHAALPSIPLEEKERLLHFIIVGGGPTGVEMAAELADFAKEDMFKYFPDLVNLFKMTIIEANEKLLPMFSNNVSDFTRSIFEEKLKINVMLEHIVTEVDEKYITLKIKHGSHNTLKFSYGILLWASGICQVPLAKKIIQKLPEQSGSNIMKVDNRLKLIGTSNVYALGDCSYLNCQKLSDNAEQLFEEARQCNEDCIEWLRKNYRKLVSTYPQLSPTKWNFSQQLPSCKTIEDFTNYLRKIDEAYRAPLPTAQNARQEGIYLANVFNKYISKEAKMQAPGFVERWYGSLAYVGANQAVANMPYFDILGGFYSLPLWKVVYLQIQLTWRSRTICIFDWLRTFFAGRDVGRDRIN